jgi:hypothetical protein
MVRTRTSAYAGDVNEDDVFTSDAEPRKPEPSRRLRIAIALVLALLSAAIAFVVLKSRRP